jgi:pyridoxine kinase
VLSTHTGGISGWTYRDLTEDILPIIDHWQTLDLEFDALYTGFLGSFEQINIVAEIFDRLKTPDNLIIVDPVMADNGQLYKIFPPNFPEGMRKLCTKADVIVPNITETVLMLDEPYQEGPYTQAYIEDCSRNWPDGRRESCADGVYFDHHRLGAASYDSKTGEISYAFSDWLEGYFHGTGDVFASALTAALLNDINIARAAEIAVDFTVGSIARTKQQVRISVLGSISNRDFLS